MRRRETSALALADRAARLSTPGATARARLHAHALTRQVGAASWHRGRALVLALLAMGTLAVLPGTVAPHPQLPAAVERAARPPEQRQPDQLERDGSREQPFADVSRATEVLRALGTRLRTSSQPTAASSWLPARLLAAQARARRSHACRRAVALPGPRRAAEQTYPLPRSNCSDPDEDDTRDA